MKKGIIRLLAALILIVSGSYIYFNIVSSRKVVIAVMSRLKEGSRTGASAVNAARMAVEKSGLSNVEIFPIDNDWEPALSLEAVKTLKNKGINLLVSMSNSSNTMAIRDFVNDNKILTFVTASTTDKISGMDDYILRNIQNVEVEQKSIAEKINEFKGPKLLIIRDLDNAAYTDRAIIHFRSFSKKDLRVIDIHLKDIDTDLLRKKVMEQAYDNAYLLMDFEIFTVGLILQLVSGINPEAKIFLNPWVGSPTLVSAAGKSIENALMGSHFPPRKKSIVVRNFMNEYLSRFGDYPFNNAMKVYMAMEIYLEAIAAGNHTPDEIKRYIIDKGNFDTRFEKTRLDRFGDSTSPLFFISDVREEFGK